MIIGAGIVRKMGRDAVIEIPELVFYQLKADCRGLLRVENYEESIGKNV